MKSGRSAIVLVAFATSVWAEVGMSPERFARNGRLDRDQAAQYFACRDNIPLAEFFIPEEGRISMERVRERMSDRLNDLAEESGHGPPWTVDEVQRLFAEEAPPGESESELPAWRRVPAVTIKYTVAGTENSFGPFRLRRSVDELRQSEKDAKGATVGYSQNFLVPNGGTFNTTGILSYPITLARNLDSHGVEGRSITGLLGPAIDWQVNQTQFSANSTQALTFSLPTIVRFSPGSRRIYEDPEEYFNEGQKLSSLFVGTFLPYYQTSFIGSYSIFGLGASLEYVGTVGPLPFQLGGYYHLPTDLLPLRNMLYQLRVIPKLDFSNTAQSGLYTSRSTGDDWLRLGGTGFP